MKLRPERRLYDVSGRLAFYPIKKRPGDSHVCFAMGHWSEPLRPLSWNALMEWFTPLTLQILEVSGYYFPLP